jgi:hypothetical protein
VNKAKINLIATILSVEKDELKTILPKYLHDEFTREAYISGGCIYSLYNGKEPNDYDFFVKSESFAQKLRDFFISLLTIDQQLELAEDETRIKIVHYNGSRIVITKNALSFDKKFQIITKFCGTPEEVVNEFDFCHNMFYHQNDKIDTLSDWDFLDSNALVYNENRARDISGTIIRVHKFCERGMTITNAEISKMLKKLRDVGFTERENDIIDNIGSY